MTSPRPELPDDLKSCQALIEQLRAELHAATEQIARLESAAAEARDTAAQTARDTAAQIARDTAAQIAHLEELLARYQATITEQEQTSEQLAADNTLLKRALFGSRRERFVDDPAQKLLFDSVPLESSQTDEGNEQPPEEKKQKRTSKGRQPRVFPDFLQREEQRFHLNPEDIPEEMRDNPHARRFFKKVGESLELIPMQLKVIEQFQEVIALDRADATTTIIGAKRAGSSDPVLRRAEPLGLPDCQPLRRSSALLPPGRHPGPERIPHRPQHAVALDARACSRRDAVGGSDVGAGSNVRRPRCG